MLGGNFKLQEICHLLHLFSFVVPVKTSPTKSPTGQKIPKKAPVVHKKQESSSEEESSDEDEPKVKAVAKPPSKTLVKPPAKPAALTKKQESSSEDSDDSKCVNFTFRQHIFLHRLIYMFSSNLFVGTCSRPIPGFEPQSSSPYKVTLLTPGA
jgi:hypothetical protein